MEPADTTLGPGMSVGTGTDYELPGNSGREPAEPSSPKDSIVYKYISYSGGAVYIIGDNLAVINSNFTNLRGDYGGSVYFKGNKALIDKSNFNMTFAIYGGALWLNGTEINVSNSNFTFTIVELAGGAIQAFGSDYVFDNLAFNMSGALGEEFTVQKNPNTSGLGSSYTLADIEFVDTEYYGGGAINIHADNIEVTDSSFEFCESTLGGAIYVNGTNVRMSGNHFNTCAADYGGAIFLDTACVGALIEDSIFNSTIFVESGGAIVAYPNDVVIKNSLFYNVTQLDTYFMGYNSLDGGAIVILGNDCKVLDSNFTHNNASSISSIIWISNILSTINDDGSLVYSKEYAYNGLVDNCRFEDNIGAAIGWAGSNGTISNSKFYNNFAENGVLVHVGYDLKITDSEFINNVGFESGAIMLESTNTTIERCIFDSNVGIEGPGALFIYGLSYAGMLLDSDNGIGAGILVNDCTFSNNTALGGGAIFWSGYKGVINNSIFYNNSAIFAGAVLWSDNDGAILNSNFTENSAVIGGAVLMGSIARIPKPAQSSYDYGYEFTFEDSSIRGCNFINNSAEYAPGVLWMDNNGLIENSTFDHNAFKSYDANRLIQEFSRVYALMYSDFTAEEVEYFLKGFDCFEGFFVIDTKIRCYARNFRIVFSYSF